MGRDRVQLHEVRFSNGAVRRYATAGEAQAAVNAASRTTNPATYHPSSTTG